MTVTLIRGCVTCGYGPEPTVFFDGAGLDHETNEIFPAKEVHRKLYDMGFRRANTPPPKKSLMVVLCSDDTLRQVHGGECRAKFWLSDLSIANAEQKRDAREFLRG